ncbi:MAG: 30S ribosomal protein S3, partial [Candidatus Hodarchaeales archaeon]
MVNMAAKYFVNNGLEYVEIDEYCKKELDRAGYGKIEIHKTPTGHRVVIHAIRLGMVIGKGGKSIKKLTTDFEDLFGLESPQLEVKELQNPELNARVMASRLISQIERGFHFRRAGYALLRRVVQSGARGCEISIKGKLTSQRARREVFRQGFVAKTGEPAHAFVDDAVLNTTLKQGVIGVHVKIMRPDANLPDEPKFYGDKIIQERLADLGPIVTDEAEDDMTEEKIQELIEEDTPDEETVEITPLNKEDIEELDEEFKDLDDLEPEAKEPEAKEPEAKESKVDESKVDESKVDESKVDESKVDESKVDESKVDESK